MWTCAGSGVAARRARQGRRLRDRPAGERVRRLARGRGRKPRISAGRSAPTRSCRQSAAAAWARCTWRTIRGSAARSRSRCSRPALTSNADAARRFEQEARAASSLNHPNIVTIYEIGDFRDRRFIAMEFVEGRSLAAMVGRPVDAATLAKLGAQLARALVGGARGGHRPSRHQARERHRARGRVREGARLRPGAARAGCRRSKTRHAITNPNLLLGTPRYMSPEQARGETASAASDVFSLGGGAVRAGDRHASVRSGIDARHAPRHHVVGGDDSAALGARPAAACSIGCCMRMLDKSAAARPSAAEVEAELSATVGRVVEHANAGIAARSRAPNAQPAASTHGARRSSRRGRQRQGSAPERRRPAADADRTGRHRQDTPRHPGGRGAGRRTSTASRSSTSRRSPTPVWSPRRSPARSGFGRAATVALVKAIAEHLRGLGRALLVIDNFEQVSDAAPLVQELLDACPGAPGAGDEPPRAPHLRRAGVPRAAAAAADARRAVLAIDADGLRVGRAFRSARCRRQAGLRR